LQIPRRLHLRHQAPCLRNKFPESFHWKYKKNKKPRQGLDLKEFTEGIGNIDEVLDEAAQAAEERFKDVARAQGVAFPEDIAEAAFLLKTPGQLSKVVKTFIGFHILKLTEKPTFKEVKTTYLSDFKKTLSP